MQDFLSHMQETGADWTTNFRALADAASGDDAPEVVSDVWTSAWHTRLAAEPYPDRSAAMRAINPLYVPRNHLIEAALTAAVQHGDYAPFETLLDVLAHPFEERPGLGQFTLQPLPAQRVLATFCGT